MALALSLISGPTFDQRTKRYVFGVALTGSYPGSDGETVNLSSYVSGDVNGLPESAWFERAAGYAIEYTKGTTIANGKATAYSAPGTVLTAAAYPAALLGAADIRLVVILPS